MSRRDTSRKEIRELLSLAEELGWQLDRTRNNHLVFRKPGRPLVYTGSTPSDPRARRNLVAQLIRADREADS